MGARHWIKSYGEIPAEIDADRYASVVELLTNAMKRHSDRPAFSAYGQTLSYRDVDRLSLAFAAYLQSRLGVKKGDRVAVMLPNLLAFPIALLGILRAAAIQVNVNPLYTARELEHQLNDAGVETIVIFNGSTPTLSEIKSRTGIRNVITVGTGDGSGATLPSPTVDARLADAVSLTEALAQGGGMPLSPVPLAGSDLLFLQYTGGTTGVSKGAALSHRNLVANTEQFKAIMPLAVQDGCEVLVTAIPLYHIFALMISLTYFSVGAENWLVANPRDMDGFVDVLRRARPTVMMGVNTLYGALVAHPKLGEVDWSRLKIAVGGGAAVVGFIREGYGLSETSPILSFNPAYITDFTGTTGLPLPSTDIKLLADDDTEVRLGEAGEICVKGPQVMAGYWQQPDANATAFTSDGYFRTGDVGVFDDQGFLRIVDRKKDMVLVSGFNVYPNEVEAVAAHCKGVAESACVGVADAKTGEAVLLVVVKTPNAELTEAEVIAHCRAGLAAYKVPKIVRFVDSLPKSNVGKILRRELRKTA
jgi:long-chain acyl-CoA synthetase